MLTIRQLAGKHGLSRATLLYYDKIGLLPPSGRSRKGYRLYSSDDDARLERICRYRTSGVAVAEILTLLEAESPRVVAALEARLEAIQQEVAGLRRQQQVILELLGTNDAAGRDRMMTREKWVALLDSVGMNAKDRNKWHRAFERQSPDAHQDFLESLGIPLAEVAAIRAHYGATTSSARGDCPKGAPIAPRRRAPHRKRAT